MVPVEGIIEILKEPARVRDIVRPPPPEIIAAHTVFLVEEVIYLSRKLVHVGTFGTADKDVVIDHTGKQRGRNQRQNILAHGTKAGRIDHIELPPKRERVPNHLSANAARSSGVEQLTGVDRAAERIRTLLCPQLIGEISLPPDHLRECGIVAGTKISGPSSLVGGKKESFVFADRAGQRAAEVILVVPPLPVTEGISRGAVRFEQAVPVEFVGGAVNSVAAGFHRKVKNSAARPRIIGADVASDQAEFTDRLSAGRQLDGRAREVIALDRDTVHLNLEAERLAAVDGAGERASRCARQAVKHK